MTIEKVIELIKHDIGYYKDLIVSKKEFSDKIGKVCASANDSATGELIQMIVSGMIITSYQEQIEFYQNILAELEKPKKDVVKPLKDNK